MVTEGDVLDLFPDQPIPTFTLTKLERNENIRAAVPLLTEERDGRELATHVVIQTKAIAIVAAYADGDWRVTDRIDGENREPSEVLETAMIRGQGDSSFVEPPEEA